MRKAISQAEVGDDVYGEDPTVARLERRVAELLGKEAALFVPSGSMANMIAVRVHTEPSDEVILEAKGHSFVYEGGGMGGISGVQAHAVHTEDGRMSAEQVEAAINPPEHHFAHTRLVIIENTSNRGGGTIYELERMNAIRDVCKRHALTLHMDGARLWNAHAATGLALEKLAAPVESVSVCLSKGLGCPVGSLLAGSKTFIHRAHRFRKMLGGGMRQVGILAAAGLYALEHNLDRLDEDHRRLRTLAEGLAALPGLSVNPERYPTNIAYIEIDSERSAQDLVKRLAAEGVLLNATGPKQLRVVTHLDLDDGQIEQALERFRAALA